MVNGNENSNNNNGNRLTHFEIVPRSEKASSFLFRVLSQYVFS